MTDPDFADWVSKPSEDKRNYTFFEESFFIEYGNGINNEQYRLQNGQYHIEMSKVIVNIIVFIARILYKLYLNSQLLNSLLNYFHLINLSTVKI